MPKDELELCMTCGKRRDEHPKKQYAYFVSSGWYDGQPTEKGGLFFLQWSDGTVTETPSIADPDSWGTEAIRHCPVVVPEPPPIPKQEVKG